MQMIWNYTRYALRRLRKSPGFTLTVVLTLALGVGANTVVFSVLNAIILRPLALPQAEQLQFFNRLGTTAGNGWATPSESWPDYRDISDRTHSFSGITAYRVLPVGASYGGVVAKSWICEASGNYFDLLGVQPVLGRFFHTSDEHGINGSPFAVLSNHLWRQRFQADPQIVGRVIELNKHPFTVLGVAPAQFLGTELFLSPDLWTPILNAGQLEAYTSFEARGDRGMWWIGRLKPQVSKAQAEADVNTVALAMQRENKDNDDGLQFRLSRPGLVGEMLGGPVRSFLFGVMALAGLVLMAACANLASLFAARATDRSREMGVRLALGAGRVTLVAQLLTESILVALLGGAAGLLAALGMLRGINLWRPALDIPVSFSLHPDARVFVFALVLSLGSGIFFALSPARGIARISPYAVIKGNQASEHGGRSWTRLTFRDLLLVLQIILCSVLVTASLVAVRGLLRSMRTSYGFVPRGALLANFDLKMAGYTDQKALVLQRRALEAIQALPGVTAAGLSNTLPLSVDSSDSSVYRDGTTDFRASNEAAQANYYDISPGYFSAAGTRLLAGRDVSWHDDAHAPPVAVVNQQFVRQVFGPGISPSQAIGRYFNRGMRCQVIAVVEDGKYVTLTEDQKPAMFLPIGQATSTLTTIVLRTGGNQAETLAAVRKTLLGLDPSMPLTINSWPQAMGLALFPSVAATTSLGVMGALAAMLAVTGIFGMASYSVSKRLRELGLRMALGAGKRKVLLAALGRPAQLLVFGSAFGLVLGALASKLLSHIVYQATSQDPIVLLGAVISMAFLALVASWVPALRATRVDPASLLREE